MNNEAYKIMKFNLINKNVDSIKLFRKLTLCILIFYKILYSILFSLLFYKIVMQFE